MEKIILEEVEKRWKEKEDKWLKITTNQLTQRVVENWVRAQFGF